MPVRRLDVSNGVPELKESSRRTSELVRRYRVPAGVAVVLGHASDALAIEAIPAEPNQVLTNHITHAQDAVSDVAGTGTVRPDRDGAVGRHCGDFSSMEGSRA